MKKFWIIATTLVMVIALCAGLTACSESTVDQLTNELGALVEGGNFKEGSVLNLNEIKLTDDEATDIVEKLENSGIAINDTTKGFIYDITVTKNNAEVQPEGKVKVTVPAPEDSKEDRYAYSRTEDFICLGAYCGLDGIF